MAPLVLLTGASGLIGRETARALRADGYEVVAASRKGASVEDFPAVKVDLLDQASVKGALKGAGFTHLVHLAWHDHPTDRWTSPANLDWAAASLRLVRTFAQEGGSRVVAAGSCAEYDWEQSHLTESSPLKPKSLYAASKSTLGMALGAAAPSLGLSLAWARIFFCYGPGEPKGRLLGDLISGLAAGKPVDCTDGLQERDFLHTADVGRALSTILGADLDGPVNAGSGKAVRVLDLIGQVSRQMGAEDLVRLGARARPKGDPAKVEADVSLLKQLGFAPRYDLQSGVAQVLRAEGVI